MTKPAFGFIVPVTLSVALFVTVAAVPAFAAGGGALVWPGAARATAYRGRPILSRSYGMADKALSIPNTPDTLFALASVTKAVTATAVIQPQNGARCPFPLPSAPTLAAFPLRSRTRSPCTRC